ncbi:MAG: ATP-dependent helicase [Armatimonadota bacterium]
MNELDISSLNSEQREAVLHVNGPLLVFAGAGSGKTRVLTMRVANLISTCGISPYEILAVTFTNKAAREMKERIDHLLGAGIAKNMWVGTFHSICARLLRMYGSEINIEPNFVIYDDGDQTALVNRIMKDLNIDPKKFAPRGILGAISKAKEQMQMPADIIRSDPWTQTVGSVYDHYQRELVQCRALDFDDLLVYALKLLQKNGMATNILQQRFRHVLVDEFQDVNKVQYNIVKTIAAKHGNLCAVGDDDQAIYSWRGADVDIILSFEKDFVNSKVVRLEKNYRSTQRILDAAFHVVSKNEKRASKRLFAQKSEGELVGVCQLTSEREEARSIAQRISLEWQKGRRELRDYAVLYRTNAQSRALEEAFMVHQLRYQVIGGLRFYQRKEVKDLLAYLRVVVNPSDTESVRRVVNLPTRGIGQTSIDALFVQSKSIRRPLFEALQMAHENRLLKGKAAVGLGQFLQLIAELQEMATRVGVSELVKTLVEATGYLEYLGRGTDAETLARRDNVGELYSVTNQFDVSEEGSGGLPAFLEQVALVSDIDSADTNGNHVSLMTVHAAKGLEFPVVFVAGMEESIFPLLRGDSSKADMDEERRLFYVALTRAKEEAYLMFTTLRSIYGESRPMIPSRFLREIPEELVMMMTPAHLASGVKPSAFDQQPEFTPEPVFTRAADVMTSRPAKPVHQSAPKTAGIRVGQRVKHPSFGDGVVMKVEPSRDDAIVTVVFPQQGIKKLLASLANLTIIK